MRFVIIFAVLACVFLFPGALGAEPGPVRIWMGLAALLLALLYLLALWPERRVGAWIRTASPLAGIARLVLMPYRWLAYLVLRTKVAMRHLRPIDEIVPGLYLGRRPLPGDRDGMATLALKAIVDLCAEFPPSGAIHGIPDADYLSIPAMDGTAPALPDIANAIEWIEQRIAAGKPVLVHCAAGHGRSATVVACLLIARGLATDAPSAQSLMQTIRPGVRLNRTQTRQVGRFVEWLATRPEPAEALQA
jgi:diacylglycerol kinase (ATP)